MVFQTYHPVLNWIMNFCFSHVRGSSGKKWRFVFWFIFFFFCELSFSQIVLTEIMFDPIGPESSDEFVEIFNLSETDSVDLAGYKLSDGTGEDLLKDAGEGMVLRPRQYGVILDPDYFGQSTSYDLLIPGETLILTIEGSTFGSAGLSNSKSETVSLIDPSGRVVETYTYSLGNRPGYSDERIDFTKGNIPENWQDSRVLLGTPGAPNSVARCSNDLGISFFQCKTHGDSVEMTVCVKNKGVGIALDFSILFFLDRNGDSLFQENEWLEEWTSEAPLAPEDSLVICRFSTLEPGFHTIGAIVHFPLDEKWEDNTAFASIGMGFSSKAILINEILFHPVSGESEWIELYNPGPKEVDLKGWYVSDNTSKKIKIVNGHFSFLPLQYLILCSDSSFVVQHPNLLESTVVLKNFPSLNNDRDKVVLYDFNQTVIDSMTYEGTWAKQGISIERDARNQWHACISPSGSTPGEENSIAFFDKPTDHCGIFVSPNPFSPDQDGKEDVAKIQFQIPFSEADARLRIYDVRGRLIRTLPVEHVVGEQGYALWDGFCDSGEPAPIGVYVLFLEVLNAKKGKVATYKTTLVLAREF